MSDLKYWLGFNLVKGIGPAKLQALLDYYGHIGAAWRAQESQLRLLGFDRRTILAFQETRQTVDLDAYQQQVEKAGLTVLTWDSEGYPAGLRQVPAAPPLLYVAGTLTEADRWAVAVVGTRRLTTYGRQITRELVTGLVHSGVTVVSGLARVLTSLPTRPPWKWVAAPLPC